ncbi:MAG: cytochrome B [Magnetococcales bacterium]|nr:cytochrome B [Magnetococcales bacterium]
MKPVIELYPLWIRLWHWTNALSFLVLLATGISLHFATPGAMLIPFEIARMLHNVFGLVMTGGWVVFVIGNWWSGNGIHYRPQRTGLIGRLLVQIQFYGVGIFRHDPHPFPAAPQAKFNPLQQLTYLGVMFGAMPVLILSGWGFFWHEWIPERFLEMDGLWVVGVIHYLVALFLTAFLIGHLYLATAGETVFGEFKKMISGSRLTEEQP